ncbi:transferase [Aureococcus anophagefferens]|nr:transferase [Aureococcus anophagefferens]
MQTVLAVLCLVPAAALVRGAPSRVAATPRKASPSAYLSEIPQGPPDAILGIAAAFRASNADDKVNVCVGAYRDDVGVPYVLPSVTEAGEGRIAGVQALSNAGVPRRGRVLRFLPEGTAVYVSDPTWGNHIPIMELAGLEVRKYRYLDRETNGLDYEAFLEDIDAAPAGSVFLLHACAHNPTGVDPTRDQWDAVSKKILAKGHHVLMDCAYQGFASAAEAGSFAKNFGLYGERVGTLSVVCKDTEEVERVMSQLKRIIRPMYSSPPIHGALIVKEIGMFAFTGMTSDMCDTLTADYAIYLTKDGRISVAGVNSGNIKYIAKAVRCPARRSASPRKSGSAVPGRRIRGFNVARAANEAPLLRDGLVVDCTRACARRVRQCARPARATTRFPALASTATPPELSVLVEGLKPSATVEVHGLTMQLRAAGEEVVSLCVGEPDFPPPKAIVDAIGAAALAGATRYTEVTGTKELREAIASDLAKRKGTAYAPTDIVVANGAKQAVYEALLALVGPGDEVVVPAPYWVSYPSMVEMAGAAVVQVDADIADGYKLTADALKSVLTPKTKALIFCNPSNPTGAVVDEAGQRELLAVLDAHEAATGKKVWVISDEIYEQLHYEPATPHASFAALGGRAGVAALNLPPALRRRRREFKRRRDLVLAQLEAIAAKRGASAARRRPRAPSTSSWTSRARSASRRGGAVDSSTSFCTALLAKRKLALVPGDAFGAPDGVRISYAASEAELTTALAAIDAFVNDDCN